MEARSLLTPRAAKANPSALRCKLQGSDIVYSNVFDEFDVIFVKFSFLYSMIHTYMHSQHTYVRTYIHKDTQTRRHTDVHAYIHTYTHICITYLHGV